MKALYHDLEVQTVEQLHRAARDGRIRALPGFGEKTELNILQAVEAHASQSAALQAGDWRRSMPKRCAPFCKPFPACSR